MPKYIILQKELEKKYPNQENLIKRAIRIHMVDKKELSEKEYIESYDLICNYINSWGKKRSDSIENILNPMMNVQDRK
jgi:hypothetical protein